MCVCVCVCVCMYVYSISYWIGFTNKGLRPNKGGMGTLLS